ncbi:MAG: SRPBCC domain-containing protein [Niabella sp.]|nr:SRPBCC domain-containing protein [Niabella sp.]
MEQTTIERSVIIHAPVQQVWRVFTDPAVTREMGGYYETDWKPGSAFAFLDTAGRKLTRGVLLAYEPQQLIRHNLLEPDNETIQSVITYTFREEGGRTVLTGREVMTHPPDPAAFEDAAAGWEFALKAVKDLAEKL